MKIKEVQAGVKISKNYDSYQVNFVADLENEESAEKVGEILIEKAMKVIQDKLGNSKDGNLKEVGAAWPHKEFSDCLSVQMSKTGKWEDVQLDELEKTNEGYRQKTNEGVFIFKKIPAEKRKNNKMPIFRIYEGEGEYGN